jgi:hypothetical protein
MLLYLLFFSFYSFNFGVLLLLCLVLLLLSGLLSVSFYSSGLFLFLIILIFFSFSLASIVLVLIFMQKLIVMIKLLNKKSKIFILMSSGLPLVSFRATPGPRCNYCKYPLRLCICRRCVSCLQVYWRCKCHCDPRKRSSIGV